MLIGMTDATEEDPGERDEHRGAADRQRHARRDELPNTSSSASAASGSEISSRRWRSRSVTAWTSP